MPRAVPRHARRRHPADESSDGELQDWFVGQAAGGQAEGRVEFARDRGEPAHASAFEHAVDIEGTPTLVVNGRYRIISGDHEAMLRTADALIAMLQRQRR